MVTPRISYAHLLAKPNPKHVESLLKFFENGRSQRGTGGFGVEIEHLPVHNSDDTAVTYYEPNGMEALLKRLAPYYDEDKEYWENGHLVGLARPGVAVSLEPGGQVETSIGILKKPSDLNTLYSKFRRELDPILDDLDFRLINYGYQPKSSFADVPVNPKDRYDAMTDYLGRVGQFGPCMMRCSASTQVSIDYVDERDSIEKLRLGTVIGPILAYFFRNTPYFEGEKNPWPLLRQRMWDYLDFQRTNVLPGLFDPRYGWEDYAIDVLSTPLMFADLTHTPEAVASGATPKELHRPAFRENAGEVLGTVIGPILAYFFRNTPYFEGEKNPWPLLRQRMWDYLDFQRTNVLPGLFDPRYGWEDYAIDVLSTPLMFADLTHTPEAVASGATPKELHRPAFRENAGEVYPDRELNPYEINHIISTHFNDVRLKNFIELRHWDSLPIERAERLTEIVSSLFYVPEHRDRLESYFEGISEEEVFEAKANIQAHGREATPYGQPLDFWKEFLGLEGLLSDIPGDLKHPDVFQE